MKKTQLPFVKRVRICAAALALAACATPATATTERTLHFPPGHSLGMLYMLDASIERKIKDFHYWIDGTEMKWEYLGEATGEVTVPANKRLRLDLNKASGNNLSGLAQLGADDLYELSIGEIASDRSLSHLSPLTGLKVLLFQYPPSSEKQPLRFTPEGLKQLRPLRSLERLRPPEQLTEACFAAIAEALPQLRGVYFKHSLTDEALAVLPRLKALEELEVGGSRISSRGLAPLAEMPSLRYLCLWGVKDEALFQVRKVTSLKTLTVPPTVTGSRSGLPGGPPKPGNSRSLQYQGH